MLSRSAGRAIVLVVMLLGLAGTALAEGPSTLPPQLYLPTMQHYWQTRNNCGPTAVAMALSVYSINVDPDAARWVLRPEPESVGMDAGRVPAFVIRYGLSARPRIDGDLDLIHHLVALGVPVIVEQWLTLGQPLAHYRVVRGYDLTRGGILVHDSTLGPDVWLSESDFMRLWTPTGRAYIPVYPASQEREIAKAVGGDWDDATMYRRAFDRAVDEVWAAPADPWVWSRLGDYAYAVGDPHTALTGWQAARTLKLPQGEWVLPARIALAELDLFDYSTALDYTNLALRYSPSSPGLHFIRGRALQGLGADVEAEKAFRRALQLEPSFTLAKSALESLIVLRSGKTID